MTSPARVAIVKSAGRADAFADAVREIGLAPVLVSPFRFEPVDGARAAVAEALKAAGTTWLVVTSPHAVDACEGLVPEWFDVAAVGPGTASALQARDFNVDLVGEGGAESLGRKIVERGIEPGDRVVHACGEDARQELRRVIERAGGTYVAVPVYRAVPDAVGERSAVGEFAAVVVGSPNLARRAAELFPSRPPCVAIGRTTASALRDLGWAPAAVAAAPSPADVAAALARALRLGA
jgi:uroporphyrinogen-III synthase